MEYSLRPPWACLPASAQMVLILILMEYSLRHKLVCTREPVWVSLNPYSNGI